MPQKLLKYDIIERLGEGAGSVIYAVRDPSNGQEYALKHVIRETDKHLRFVEQVKSEFELSKQFNHPNLRKSHELVINRRFMFRLTEVFLLMELVRGKSLDVRAPSDFLAQTDVFMQAAKGLRAMHDMGYIHCDIKPNNIICCDNGDVKIIDFGQSCRAGTVKERIQGTPDYIAPEQVKRLPVDPQTDVFNLGATLYWALSGRTIPTLYKVGKSDNSFLVDTRIESPIEVNPRVPPTLSKLAMDCVMTNPQKRPSGMGEVITRLELARHVLAKNS